MFETAYWFESGKPDTNFVGEIFRSRSEIASHLVFQQEVTGAEPVATQGTNGVTCLDPLV